MVTADTPDSMRAGHHPEYISDVGCDHTSSLTCDYDTELFVHTVGARSCCSRIDSIGGIGNVDLHHVETMSFLRACYT
jgi:hypothetical protein